MLAQHLEGVGLVDGITFHQYCLGSLGGRSAAERPVGLQDVAVEAMSTPMHATSLEQWWEHVPKLAGPLAIVLAGMEADARNAIAERAMQAGAKAAAAEGDGIVFAGSVLIGSGHKAAH